MKNEVKELFIKSRENPILTAGQWPYPVDRVFNPAAVSYDGETILLVRVEDRRGFSRLGVARSADGIKEWKIAPNSAFEPDHQENEHQKGFEDPRVVWVPDLKKFIIACVSFREDRIDVPYGISLIGTENFRTFTRISKPLDPGNKNASLFPRKIKGFFALIHRPVVSGVSYVAVSFSDSDDLRDWRDERVLFSTRPWYWDSEKIGLACPPIETKEGWVIIYHGSQGWAHKLIYRVGLALLDLEDLRLIRRSEEWVLKPEKDFEGGNSGIVFPCGYTLNKATGELRVYYGTNDSSVGMAVSNIKEVLEYLRNCPANED